MHVFLMGGTGLVGSRLIQRLLDRKDDVTLLTRRPEIARQKWGEKCTVVAGDPMTQGPWMESVANCDAVVNLVGEGVFNRRWRSWFKDLLVKSRVESTKNVVKALEKSPKTSTGQPKVLVNASAIGYYGPTGEKELDEESPAGADFLAKLCVDWENAASAGEVFGCRVVRVRIGIVLDKAGGPLQKMLTPFKLFVGGKVASGKQYMSWIHHEDLARLILFCLDRAEVHGPVNGTSPEPVTNKVFSNNLGRVLHRPSFMPTPRIMLRLMLGEVAHIVTTGQRVLPKKALSFGFTFQFPEIKAALTNVLYG